MEHDDDDIIDLILKKDQRKKWREKWSKIDLKTNFKKKNRLPSSLWQNRL